MALLPQDLVSGKKVLVLIPPGRDPRVSYDTHRRFNRRVGTIFGAVNARSAMVHVSFGCKFEYKLLPVEWLFITNELLAQPRRVGERLK